jgi:hypothetical protein
MVGERYAKSAASPIEPGRRFAAFSHGAPPWSLQIPSRPAPFLHSLAKVRCVACAVSSFRSASRGPEWGPGPARERPAMLRSSCVPACRPLVLSNRALPPQRASRRGVRHSKCYAGGAMSRGTRKAAIEPTSRRGERLGRACSSTPASAALETMSRVALRVQPNGHRLKVTNPAAPSARGKAKGRLVVHALEGWHLSLLLPLGAQLRHLRSGGCLNVALVTGP